MSDTAWLAQRAALAVALMIGFYVLAAGVAVGLLWIPYAEWMYLDGVHGKIAFFCVATAGALLWAVVPRPDTFEAPGPRLEEASHRELFAAIRDVAAATKQAMPADVFLVNEVNAWVTHRGGIMGFGSHRVMGLGLPLLQGLTISQLKAVLAHEFGHYAAGDVRLGPWIYKTRAAIGRTLEGLQASWLSFIFEAYGRMFLRLTHAISREQEFMADALAARTVHPASMAAADTAVPETDEAVQRAAQALAIGVAVLLLDAGATPDTGPGRPIAFHLSGVTMEPFTAVQLLAAGKLSQAEWQAQCRATGIAGRPLGAAAAA